MGISGFISFSPDFESSKFITMEYVGDIKAEGNYIIVGSTRFYRIVQCDKQLAIADNNRLVGCPCYFKKNVGKRLHQLILRYGMDNSLITQSIACDSRQRSTLQPTQDYPNSPLILCNPNQQEVLVPSSNYLNIPSFSVFINNDNGVSTFSGAENMDGFIGYSMYANDQNCYPSGIGITCQPHYYAVTQINPTQFSTPYDPNVISYSVGYYYGSLNFTFIAKIDNCPGLWVMIPGPQTAHTGSNR